MNAERFRTAIVLGIALLFISGVARYSWASNPFVVPGYFAFDGADFARIDQTKWLADCDGEGFPDLAVVYRKKRSLFVRAKYAVGIGGMNRVVSANIYSGRTGSVLNSWNFPTRPGLCIEIQEFDASANQLLTVHRLDGRNSLYANGTKVRSQVKSPTDLLSYWDLEETDTWAAAAGLRELIPDGRSRLVTVGMAVDPQSQKRVFVAFVERWSEDMRAGAWIWLDYNTAEVLKAERIYSQDLSVDAPPRWIPVRVSDFDGDRTLDCEYIARSFHIRRGDDSNSYMRVYGASPGEPQFFARADDPPQYVRNLTQLENFDRPWSMAPMSSDGRRLKLSLLRPRDLSIRVEGELPELLYLPEWETTVHEIGYLNGDKFRELAVEFPESANERWRASYILLDGASLKLFTAKPSHK